MDLTRAFARAASISALAVSLGSCSWVETSSRSITAQDLFADWIRAGKGSVVEFMGGQGIELREADDSGGFMILSPSEYGRHVLEPPDAYDGSWSYWSSPDSHVESYAIAFHTGFHQPNAFIRKNPGLQPLAETTDPANEERWYDVEVRRQGALITLRIDGKPVLRARDEGGGIPGGRIALRVRGPGDGTFSARFRNLRVQELDPSQ